MSNPFLTLWAAAGLELIPSSYLIRRMKADNTREDFFKHILSEKSGNVTEAQVVAEANTLM